jgi:hypothetical protein
MALLTQKFKRTPDYDQEKLIRDLILLVEELEARLVAIEQRLTAGGL